MDHNMKKRFNWKTERYYLHELGPQEARKVEIDRGHPGLSDELEEISRSNDDFFARHPKDIFISQVDRVLKSRNKTEDNAVPRFFDRFIRGNKALSAVISCLMILIVSFVMYDTLYVSKPAVHETPGSQRHPETTRDKGLMPFLVIHKKAGDGSEQLSDPSRVSANDVIQVSYVAAKMKYGTIISIDGKGTVTLHYPENIHGSSRLENKNIVPLGHAYRLDYAPGFEKFFFVTSPRRIDIEEVISSARKLAVNPRKVRDEKLDLPGGFHQNTFLLLKEQR